MKSIIIATTFLYSMTAKAETTATQKFEAPAMLAYSDKGEPTYMVLIDGKYQKVTKQKFMSIVETTVASAKEIACKLKPDTVTVEVKGFIGLTWETEKWCPKI